MRNLVLIFGISIQASKLTYTQELARRDTEKSNYNHKRSYRLDLLQDIQNAEGEESLKSHFLLKINDADIDESLKAALLRFLEKVKSENDAALLENSVNDAISIGSITDASVQKGLIKLYSECKSLDDYGLTSPYLDTAISIQTSMLEEDIKEKLYKRLGNAIQMSKTNKGRSNLSFVRNDLHSAIEAAKPEITNSTLNTPDPSTADSVTPATKHLTFNSAAYGIGAAGIAASFAAIFYFRRSTKKPDGAPNDKEHPISDIIINV